jgi:hypothetical protein
MPFPTREEFLNYVHIPLSNPRGDPRAGSPTKSTMRYRWRELRDWDIETEAAEYWTRSPLEDKLAPVLVLPANHWESVRAQLTMFTQPFTSEPSLRDPFGVAFRSGHNGAIRGASDGHAEIWSDATGLDGEPPIGNADLIFVYDNKSTGIIELKTWWKVNQAQIEEVKTGMDFNELIN